MGTQVQHIDAEVARFQRRSPRPVLAGALLCGERVVSFGHGGAGAGHDPVFEIGSIGKTFTTTLLALLVRDGVVSLDDPVARFRPQYPFSATVTLRQLASHAAGLPANPAGGWTMLLRGRRFAAGFRPDDLDACLHRQPARPRTLGRFAYSNVGMALLGNLLADCLGTDYAQAVQARILQPLGMHDTRTDPAGYPPGRLLDGHDARGRRTPPMRWHGMEPAGVWFSTVPDMTRFLRAQAGLDDPAWAALARTMLAPLAKVSSDTRAGLGWMRSPVDGIGDVAWHSGGTFGQHAVVQWALERPLGVVLLGNRRPPLWHHLSAARRLEDLADRIMAAGATGR